jgi:hypothetical protein
MNAWCWIGALLRYITKWTTWLEERSDVPSVLIPAAIKVHE